MKVAVITIQVVPQGFSPYFIPVGRPQTINEIYDFGEFSVKACVEAANSVVNSVILNHSTDGFSCDIECNLTTMINCLEGNSNQILFTDTNQNVKNGRYQMVGGSCAAIIGFFLFCTMADKDVRCRQRDHQGKGLCL